MSNIIPGDDAEDEDGWCTARGGPRRSIAPPMSGDESRSKDGAAVVVALGCDSSVKGGKV